MPRKHKVTERSLSNQYSQLISLINSVLKGYPENQNHNLPQKFDINKIDVEALKQYLDSFIRNKDNLKGFALLHAVKADQLYDWSRDSLEYFSKDFEMYQEELIGESS